MGLGRNFVPCDRVDGSIQMKIQVDPMVVTFGELVTDIVSHMMDVSDAYDFTKYSRKDVIKQIKLNAEYASYHGGICMKQPDLIDSYYGEPQVVEYNTSILLVANKIKELFPQWKDEPIKRLYHTEDQ